MNRETNITDASHLFTKLHNNNTIVKRKTNYSTYIFFNLFCDLSSLVIIFTPYCVGYKLRCTDRLSLFVEGGAFRRYLGLLLLVLDSFSVRPLFLLPAKRFSSFSMNLAVASSSTGVSGSTSMLITIPFSRTNSNTVPQ